MDELFAQTLALRDRSAKLHEEAENALAEFHRAIRRLHSSGGSLRVIAGELGMSHQRVHQIVGPLHVAAQALDSLVPGQSDSLRAHLDILVNQRPGTTRPLGDVIAEAGRESVALGHIHVGPEHLLLALMRTPSDPAAEVLAVMDVTYGSVLAAVTDILGEGPRGGRSSGNAQLQAVLDEASDEAARAGHGEPDSRHLLLALLGPSGAERSAPAPATRATPPPGLACAFCGREHCEVAKLIAGPGTYICTDCVGLAEAVVGGAPVAADDRTTISGVARGSRTACAFCGKSRRQVKGMAKVSGAVICDVCVGLCNEIIDEQGV